MHGMVLFSQIVSTIMLLLGAALAVWTFFLHGESLKTKCYISLSVVVFVIMLLLLVFPINSEEYTNTVTITDVGDGFFNYNSAYFEYEGNEYNIAINSGEHHIK